jgi:hypothetical protein
MTLCCEQPLIERHFQAEESEFVFLLPHDQLLHLPVVPGGVMTSLSVPITISPPPLPLSTLDVFALLLVFALAIVFSPFCGQGNLLGNDGAEVPPALTQV